MDRLEEAPFQDDAPTLTGALGGGRRRGRGRGPGPGRAKITPATATATATTTAFFPYPNGIGGLGPAEPKRGKEWKTFEGFHVTPAAAAGFALVLSLQMVACSGTLDAGADEPKGKLPVDERNPVIICNDGPKDNWQGEYAVLLASTGALSLVGIIVDSSKFWPNLDENMSGWLGMVDAARQAGLEHIPDPVRSNGPVLVRPSDGNIDATVPNGSEGALLIRDLSKQLSLPFRPLVVVTGGALTDVADAYLLDRTVADRVVVVSWLGSTTSDGAEMGVPNGDLDPWADTIVAQRLRYIQISAVYDQATDVPSSILPQLPTNPFTSWIRTKQPDVWSGLVVADQVGVLAVALPKFVAGVVHVTQKGTGDNELPALVEDTNGPDWLVTQVSNALAPARLWQLLLDPNTYQPH